VTKIVFKCYKNIYTSKLCLSNEWEFIQSSYRGSTKISESIESIAVDVQTMTIQYEYKTKTFFVENTKFVSRV